MSLCPIHARPHRTCPIHTSSRSYSEPAHIIPYSPRQGLPRAQSYTPGYLDSYPPPHSTLPTIRAPQRAGGLARRENVQRDAVLIEQRYESQSQRNGVKRRVHFDLPAHTMSQQHTSTPNDHFIRPAPPRQDPSPSARPRQSSQAPPRPLRSILTPPAPQPQPPPYPPLNLPPAQPTIYILTYSTSLLTPNTPASFTSFLQTHLPHRNPPIPHLYTIDASNMLIPPTHLCAVYSGLSPVIQAHVLRDARARKAVRSGVRDLLDFGAGEGRQYGQKERRTSRERGQTARMEVAMSVCCHSGTHRSVAIADLIAQEVRSEVGRLGLKEGVRVVVRHVHRVKGEMDPF